MTFKPHLWVKEWDSVSLNVDITGQHVLWAQCIRGLDEQWSTRGEDSIVPSAAGRTSRSRVRDYLVIEIIGVVVGTGATPALQVADTRSRLSALRTLFDPTKDPADLVVGLEDGDEATIACRVENMVMNGFYPDPVFRPFSVEFRAVGGDWVVAAP